MNKKRLRYSPVEHFIEAAYLGRSKEVYVTAFALYVDDSGTSPENNIAVAAGWISKMPTWKFFEREWDKVRNVQSHKFSCMHMADFVDGRGSKNEFKEWDLEQKLRVSKKLRAVIKKRAICGFALGVVKKDYDDLVPDALKAQGFENHYTYAIRRVLGMIDEWRQRRHEQDKPIEYVFDWLESRDERHKEIEKVFSNSIGTDEGFRRYGLKPGGVNFRDKKDITPLQAADMLAWTVYRACLNEVENAKINPIAFETFKDFYLHKHKGFIEGGYNTRDQLAEWVKHKGF